MLRMLPPRKLAAYEPPPAHRARAGDARPETAAALRDGLDGSRRRIPQAFISIVKSGRLPS